MPTPLCAPGLDDAPYREWLKGAEDGERLGFKVAHDKKASITAPMKFAPEFGDSDDLFDAQRPTRPQKESPIAVELVRGADGPDKNVDKWTVLIDGVRCNPVQRPTEDFQDMRDVYYLPPPVLDPFVKFSPEAVRPVAFAVRLEAEALRPAKVELVVEQVVESSETAANRADSSVERFWIGTGSRIGLEESQTLNTKEITPYTPHTHVAKSVQTMYPFRAPAYSKVVLMRTKEAEFDTNFKVKLFEEVADKLSKAAERNDKWEKKVALRNRATAWTAAQFALDQQILQDRRADADATWNRRQLRINANYPNQIARMRRTNVSRGQQGYILRNQPPQAAVVQVDVGRFLRDRELKRQFRKLESATQQQLKPPKAKFKIPQNAVFRAAEFQPTLSRRLYMERGREKCTIIGGQTTSAVHELGELFGQLQEALELIKSSSDFASPSNPDLSQTDPLAEPTSADSDVDPDAAPSEEERICKLVLRMRQFLYARGRSKAKDLLEALFFLRPSFASYNKGSLSLPWLEELRKASGYEKIGNLRDDEQRQIQEDKYNAAIQKQEEKDIDVKEGGFSNFILYDYLSLEELKKSTCRMRFRVDVTAHGDTQPSESFWFEAARQDGLEAHAAYTDLDEAVDTLQKKIDKFKKSLMVEKQGDSSMKKMLDAIDTLVQSTGDFGKNVLRRGNFLSTVVGTVRSFLKNNDQFWKDRFKDDAAIAADLLPKLQKEVLGRNRVQMGLSSAQSTAFTAFFKKFAEVTAEFFGSMANIRVIKENSILSSDPLRLFFAFLDCQEAGYLVFELFDGMSKKDEDAELCAKIKEGFQFFEGTLYEISSMVEQVKPATLREDEEERRGCALAEELFKDSEESAGRPGTDKELDYLDRQSVKENKRRQLLAEQTDLCARMPQIVECEIPHIPKFLPAKDNEVQILTANDTLFDSQIPMTSRVFTIASQMLATVTLGLVVGKGTEAVDIQRLNQMSLAAWMSSIFGSSLKTLAAGITIATSAAKSFAWANLTRAPVAAIVAGGALPAPSAAAAATVGGLQVMESLFSWITSRLLEADEQRALVTADAAKSGLNAGAFMARALIQRHRAKASRVEKLKKQTHDCMEKARGNPVDSAVKNATNTLQNLKSLERLAVANNAKLLNGDGTRFQFYERHHVHKDEYDSFLQTLANPPKQSEWDRAPDGLALRFVAPEELVTLVHEVETLRRVPTSAAIARVADTEQSPLGRNGTDLHRLTAERIHTHMQAAVRDGWLFSRPTNSTVTTRRQRNFLTRSASRTSTELALEACKLLEAAYCTKLPTLVDRQDAFFDCFAGGAAARLAMHHIDIIQKIETLIRADDIQDDNTINTQERDYLAAKKHWTQLQKEVVEKLCKNWRLAARQAGTSIVGQLDPEKASMEALGAFGRVAALSNQDSVGPRLAAASSVAVLYNTLGPTAPQERREEMLRAFAAASAQTEGFKYQRKLTRLETSPRSTVPHTRHKVSFAARRLDVDVLRSAPFGEGVDALVDALGPTNLLHVSDETEHYYVAGGDRLDFQPSPLLYSGTVAQPVWLEDVVQACDRVLATLRLWKTIVLAPGSSLLCVRKSSQPGFARHPLVVTRRALDESGCDEIAVRLLRYKEPAEPWRNVNVGPVTTLLQAMATVCGDGEGEDEAEVQRATLAAAIAQQTVKRARVFAFNADRCAAGLALASSNHRTEVDAGDSGFRVTEAVVAIAIADTTSTEVALHVTDLELAGAVIANVQTHCKKAIALGCKAVTLAELSLTLVDLEENEENEENTV